MNLDELIAEAELGEEAKGFLEGNLGKYLKGVAEQEIRLRQDALLGVDAEDAKAVRVLQNEAYRWRMFVELLDGLVSGGNQAIEVFKQQTDTQG